MSAATSETRPPALLPPPCGCSWLTGTPPLLGHSNKTYLGRKLVVWKAEERKRFTNQPFQQKEVEAMVRLLSGWAPGQWKFLDVVYTDNLSDAEATEMLQRLHITEARHRIQQLNGGGRKPWKEKMTVIKDKETQLTFNNRDANRKNLLRCCGSVYPQTDRHGNVEIWPEMQFFQQRPRALRSYWRLF